MLQSQIYALSKQLSGASFLPIELIQTDLVFIDAPSHNVLHFFLKKALKSFTSFLPLSCCEY